MTSLQYDIIGPLREWHGKLTHDTSDIMSRFITIHNIRFLNPVLKNNTHTHKTQNWTLSVTPSLLLAVPVNTSAARWFHKGRRTERQTDWPSDENDLNLTRSNLIGRHRFYQSAWKQTFQGKHFWERTHHHWICQVCQVSSIKSFIIIIAYYVWITD